MPSIIETLHNTRPLLLMLDYDGTLTPIVEHYQEAQITSEGVETLRRLSRLPDVQLAIVSGRSVSQLLAFLSPLSGEAIYLVGLHGGEVYNLADSAVIQSPSPSYKTGIAALEDYLISCNIQSLPGIELEDKGFSLGVHYRSASKEDVEHALNCLRQGLSSLGLSIDFILRPGKKLMEAVPKGFNKGVGVEELALLATMRFGVRPSLAYIGDDITDFDAFRVVNRYQGFSIYVGERLPPEAPEVTLVLPDVPGVYTFLWQAF